MIDYSIIRRPILTEKTNIQKDQYNQVTFEVDAKGKPYRSQTCGRTDLQRESGRHSNHARAWKVQTPWPDIG